MSREGFAWLAILFITVIWASSLIMAKIVFAENMTPIVFVALRYTVACPFLALPALIARRRTKAQHDPELNWCLLLLVGLSGPFISQTLQYLGLNITIASDALLLLNLSPVFAVLLALPILSEQITGDKAVGLLLATLGAILIVMTPVPVEWLPDTTRILGDLVVILSTFFFAINGIIGKIAVKTMNSITVTFYSTFFSIPFIWLSAAIFEDVTVIFRLSLLSWVVVLWVGIVNTALTFILYYESMRYIEASKVQITLNLIAVWGVMMSILFLHEAIFPLQILGGIIAILGVIITQKSRNPESGIKPLGETS
ncbi:MAG: DMT family transporter [Candidatus Thorarchaeota archaeon]|nr:DMT family transporter [Candidatus Thorarchaeota archaeon]